MALVLDTGIVVALANRHDRHHEACVELVSTAREPLLLPAPTLVEIDYWFHKRFGPDAWHQFVDDIGRGAFIVEPTAQADLVRAAELQRQYANLDLGLVDASVVALCERLGERKVATVDRRHFSIISPRHVDRLEILPA